MYGHWALDTREERGECDGAQVGWEREAFHSPNNVSKYTPWVPPQLDGRRTSATANRSLLNTASLRSPNLCPLSLSLLFTHFLCALTNILVHTFRYFSLLISLSLFFPTLLLKPMLSMLQSRLLIFHFPFLA